jgi:hypothetical protein
MDYSPSEAGKKDAASVTCQKTVAAQVRAYARKRHLLLRNCLNALEAHQAAETAGVKAGQLQRLWNTAVKKCVEPSATAKDERTMLGKLVTARVSAIAAIEKKCGTPGETALDGKVIGHKASSDLTEAQIATHTDTAACRVDDVVSRGYHGAADLLHTMTARGSQGGAPLDVYFTCLLQGGEGSS